MLEVDKIDTFYGPFQALRQISLTVGDGEFVAIFGPNGHGKSTLLKTVCGLIHPVSGQISFNGVRIDRLPTYELVRRGLVYIAEERHLFPEMTVIENLKLGAYNCGARLKMEENLSYVYKLFPKLKVLEKRRASSLSGGEARMLAVGRGLMSNGEFLAIDEPSFGLAPNLKADMFKAIKEINKRGASILMVEQTTTHAVDFADRIYFLEDGSITFEGRKDEVLTNERVKELFFGT